ncbi:MAG TPA: hypothetical protein V6C78_10075 [Crinalium sp.]|jgi:hypothetical protein
MPKRRLPPKPQFVHENIKSLRASLKELQLLQTQLEKWENADPNRTTAKILNKMLIQTQQIQQQITEFQLKCDRENQGAAKPQILAVKSPDGTMITSLPRHEAPEENRLQATQFTGLKSASPGSRKKNQK